MRNWKYWIGLIVAFCLALGAIVFVVINPSGPVVSGSLWPGSTLVIEHEGKHRVDIEVRNQYDGVQVVVDGVIEVITSTRSFDNPALVTNISDRRVLYKAISLDNRPLKTDVDISWHTIDKKIEVVLMVIGVILFVAAVAFFLLVIALP